MDYLRVPEPRLIAEHFSDALRSSVRKEQPYTHWTLVRRAAGRTVRRRAASAHPAAAYR